jgi:hypothetical protein
MNLRNARTRKTSRPAGAGAAPITRSGEYAVGQPHAHASESAFDSGIDAEWPFAELDPSSPSTMARVCDAVHVRGEAGDGVVYLVEGEVAWVRLSEPTRARAGLMPFHERLVASGAVSRSEIELVAALSRADGADVCERLVDLGLIDEDELRDVLRDTVRDHLRALVGMASREASWTRATVSIGHQLAMPLDEVLERADVRRWRRLVVEAGGSPAGRHDEARVPLRRTAEVDTVHGTMMMTTLDISEAGMRLRASSLVPIASRVVVRLSIAGDKLELAGRVVRFDRSGDSGPPVLVVLWTELPEATEIAFARILDALY